MSKKCVLPWIHIETSPTGEARPCCMYKGTVGNFATQSLDEIWNSQKLNDLRQQFIEGKQPKACENCWKTEEAGNRSKRQVDNERFAHRLDRIGQEVKPPVYLDLKLGTVCNLKCRTCSTNNSFKWADDEMAMYGHLINTDLKSYWVSDESPFWNDIEQILPHVEYFDFTGGEPFLIKRHVDLLEKCVELGYAKNISIHYNTNGTILPTDRMFEIWKHFKWVEVMFSLDGIGERFNYIRNPANWNEVQENFSAVQNKNYLHVSICHTVSMLNVYYLPEFLEWFDSTGLSKDRLYLNLLHYPLHYNVKMLPHAVKNKIKENLIDSRTQSIVDFMFSEQVNAAQDFFKYTNILDKVRDESFSKTFPELSELLNEYSRTRLL